MTNVNGTLGAAVIALKGGSIDGTGLIVGSVNNAGGDIQAGPNLTSPGILSIGGPSLPGSYTQGKKGTMSELVASAAAGQFGTIKVNGAVSLAGSLNVEVLGGFKFAAGQSFEAMTFAKRKLTGTFGEIDDGASIGGPDDVKIAGGLALVAVYDNAGGTIDLDVVATTDSVATFKAKEAVLDEISGGFAVSDTAAHVQADLAGLEADIAHVGSVTIAGSGPQVLTITKAEKTQDAALLNKLRGKFTLKVVNNDAAVTAADDGARDTFRFVADPGDVSGVSPTRASFDRSPAEVRGADAILAGVRSDFQF